VLKEVIIPAIEKEVNEGKSFAPLRQVYSGMLLATWYKKALKESILGKVYADQGKVRGIDQDPGINQEIYAQYVQAFRQGVFNMIREDVDRYTNEVIPRKYFSGGLKNDFAQALAYEPSRENAAPVILRSVTDTDHVSARFDHAQGAGDVTTRNLATRLMARVSNRPVYMLRRTGLLVIGWQSLYETLHRFSGLVLESREYGQEGPLVDFLSGIQRIDVERRTIRREEMDRALTNGAAAFNALMQGGLFEERDGTTGMIAHGVDIAGIIRDRIEERSWQDVYEFVTDAYRVRFVYEDGYEAVSNQDLYERILANWARDIFHERKSSELLMDLIRASLPAEAEGELLFPLVPESPKRVVIPAWDQESRGEFLARLRKIRAWSGVVDIYGVRGERDFFRAYREVESGRVIVESYDEDEAMAVSLPRPDREGASFQGLAQDSAMSMPPQGIARDLVSYVTSHGRITHVDQAMKGGVDLNVSNLDLQIRRDGQGILLPVHQQDLENIRINGLVPVILDIRPASGVAGLVI
jgi:hypothetical protein